jgi:menaquinol-cytochrome c reductase iron-sulfur subunit
MNYNRRDFLNKGKASLFGFLTVSVLPISLTGCGNNKEINRERMIKLGKLKEIQKGSFPKKIKYSGKVKNGLFTQDHKGFVYVVKDAENKELLFMSPLCTHLECTTTFADDNMKAEGIAFYCPCHRGAFDEQGINIGGPPERPLDIYEFFVLEGYVYLAILEPIKRS